MFLWLGGLLAASLVLVQQIVKPRLPVYKLKIQSLWPSGIQSTRITADVELWNTNYMTLDVYALSFDMYSTKRDGALAYVGSLIDRHQHQNNVTQPIWSVPPRSYFETTDDLFVTPVTTALLQTYLPWKAPFWDSVVVPISGVAHIKAAGKLPLTITILCDNRLEIYKRLVLGLECSMYKLQPGWLDMNQTVHQLREYTLRLPVNATGGILTHPTASWLDIIYQVAWEEAMHIV